LISRDGKRGVQVVQAVAATKSDDPRTLNVRVIATLAKFVSTCNLYAFRLINNDFFYRANMFAEEPMLTYLEEYDACYSFRLFVDAS
jgi:hypothetical protein